MKPIFINNGDDDNTGDHMINPQFSFPEFASCPWSDWRRYDLTKGEEPIIISGGFCHPDKGSIFMQTACKARKVILWGVGHNTHNDQKAPNWQAFLEGAALIGMRDRVLAEMYPDWIHYTPCPSTMNPAWKNCPPVPANGKVILYEHRCFPFPETLRDKYSRFTNRASDTPDVKNFLERIAGYETVITNSYHGAMWASIAGRRTIVWRPFSTKFFTGLPVALPFVQLEKEIEPWLHRPCAAIVDYNFLVRKTEEFLVKLRAKLTEWGCNWTS